jgi:tetratricopeptide (TPR) repeat protein
MVEIANHLNDNEKLFLSHFDMGVSTTSTTSIQHYNIALKYTNPEKDKRRITAIYNNLSAKYLELGDLDSAISCAEKAFKISKEINRIEGMAAASLRVANACYFKNDFNTAIAKGKQGLQLFKQAEILRRQDACAKVIGESYKELGNYKEALYYFEMMNVLKDSLESITQLNDAEFVDKKFAYELIQKEDSISLSKERTVSKLKLENINNALSKEKFKRYILYGGLGMILIFAIFLIITIQRKKRDNTIIKEQKQIVDEKNKEITDSIKYAKRIQNAILPHDKLVKEYLPNSFILYKPKDIVAGDFYWIEHKNNTTLFAAADCTGHGVPGAMVSVICNNALNRSVKEYGLTTPGEILDKTRQIVIQEFEKSDEDVKDGMDIALCSIKEQTLLYSGANNPLWVIKNNKLTEIFANKQPIGKFDKLEPFTTHSIKLEKNDTIYIFSDGFSDQFGGKKGKKFKSSKLKDLLISIQNKTMLEQRDILNYTFENWKGSRRCLYYWHKILIYR